MLTKNFHKTQARKRVSPPKENLSADQTGLIRIIPLGGVEEIGKNMTLVEIGNDIIVIDMGFQFTSEEETPGVDYILPDTTYLERNKHKIRAVVITHGHYDHIGGIPYIINKLGNPPIYTRLFASGIIKKRQDEFPYLPPLKIQIIEKDGKIKAGNLVVRFYRVTHTIPDSMGVIIETPYGNVNFTGDLKIDHKDTVPLDYEMETFTKLSKENNLVLLSDSTNVDKPGWSFSEYAVHENLKKIIDEMDGRLIIGTFASLIERVIFIVEYAEKIGKKVAIEGRSMKTNVAIAKELGYLKEKRGTLIQTKEIDNYPPSKVIIIATGAQGEEFAALMRLGTGRHKDIKLHAGDTVLLSSSIVPGNEKDVQKLKDNLSRRGAKIIHYLIASVHGSGHANKDELGWIIKMVKPKFFIPIHGYAYFVRVHAQLAQDMSIPKENIIVPDDGSIVEIYERGQKIRVLKEKAPAGLIMVDGLGTGNVQEVVIRDRQQLSQDGMFVVIATIDIATGKIRKSPDIISRGFVYLKESQDLLRKTRGLVKKTIEDAVEQMHPINFDYVKNLVRERVAKMLFSETKKRPIVIPVILEV